MAWSLIFILVALSLSHAHDEFRGFKVIRTTPRNKDHMNLLFQLEENDELDFWKEPKRIGLDVDIQLSPNKYESLVKELNKRGLEFKILQHDVQQTIDEQIRPKSFFSRYDWYSTYHTLEQIVSKMKLLDYEYKNAQMFSIGKSYQGRDMNVMELKGKQFANKPAIFMNCGMHAREWVTQATCMYMIKELLSRYGTDSKVTAIMDKMDFYIMPVLNVDGYVYTWEGGRARFWRKTRSPGPPGKRYCTGTDPNRNWGFKWGLPGSDNNPCSSLYRGPSAFSEVEIRNVRDFLIELKPVGYLDIHAYSQLWMIPFGYTKTESKDDDELMRVSNAAIKAIRDAGYGTIYKAGSSSKIIYVNSGSSKDYTYGELGIKYSFALELRDTGNYGFLLPDHLILPTAIETLAGILKMAEEMKI